MEVTLCSGTSVFWINGGPVESSVEPQADAAEVKHHIGILVVRKSS